MSIGGHSLQKVSRYWFLIVEQMSDITQYIIYLIVLSLLLALVAQISSVIKFAIQKCSNHGCMVGYLNICSIMIMILS